MKETFPKFLAYWEAYIRDFGSEDGICVQMMPFGEYTIDVMKSADEAEMKKIFDFVEYLLIHGNESVQNAMTTGYLEYVMSQDPDEAKFSICVKFLGANSIAYCKAWDEFTGCRTEGLWENESPS
jgi:hypothetical protein